MTEGPTPAEATPAPARRVDRNRRTPLWILIQQFSRVITTVFFDLKVYGAYNIPKSGGVLLVSNHQSYLDPVLLSIGIDRTLSYLAKAELFKNKVFGGAIHSLNAFPVEQGKGDVGAVKEAVSRLHQGYLLNIYPEGSRSDNGDILPLEKGSSLVIRRAKVPVVPAVITGSFEAWPKWKRFPRPYPIRIHFGEPMYNLHEMDRDEIMAIIDRTLRTMYADLRAGKIPKNVPRPPGR